MKNNFAYNFIHLNTNENKNIRRSNDNLKNLYLSTNEEEEFPKKNNNLYLRKSPDPRNIDISVENQLKSRDILISDLMKKNQILSNENQRLQNIIDNKYKINSSSDKIRKLINNYNNKKNIFNLNLMNNKKISLNKNNYFPNNLNLQFYIDDIKNLQNELNKKNEYIEKLQKQIKAINFENNKIKYENIKLKEENIELKKSKEKNQNLFLKDNKKIMLKNKPDFSSEEKEELEFPKGEHYYELIKDFNINPKYKNNNNKDGNKSEKIQLYFSLNNVSNPNDLHSFTISIINNKKIGNVEFLGCLEDKIGNNIEFGTCFQIDYYFQAEQIIIIEPRVNKEEIEEKIEYALCDLMKSKENRVSINIKNIGTLQINYINLKNQDNILRTEISTFQFGITLKNKSIFKVNKIHNIFYVIKNYKDGKTKRPVYKSKEYDFELEIKNQTSLIKFDSEILCGNKNDLIFLELYYPSYNKKNVSIGEAVFNLNKLEYELKEDGYGIIDIQNKDGIIGELEIIYNIEKKMTFEQFIKKGTINLDIAIDYTKSNKIPTDPSSLHYNNENFENDYEKAIKSCGDIIAYYDADQLFPVYGFGGIPEGHKETSHCFNINFSKDDPNIHGVEHIIKFYKDSLNRVELSYPTFFSPIIRKVIKEINYDLVNKKNENHYYILMILTDGKIKDMEDTKNCIVEGSKLPLSIVIIGIGNANFTYMEILDGDEKPLTSSSGEIRKRDIVQFVEFNKFKDQDSENCGPHLAEEILKEIPRQIEEYYEFCGEFYEQSD